MPSVIGDVGASLGALVALWAGLLAGAAVLGGAGVVTAVLLFEGSGTPGCCTAHGSAAYADNAVIAINVIVASERVRLAPIDLLVISDLF
ncbi:MAG: hypothetical protein KGS72_15370 [Cyanobacteria bacterium REEB67]|nr:hypothetical protein [Cyanobacteria bacterium REEB67]